MSKEESYTEKYKRKYGVETYLKRERDRQRKYRKENPEKAKEIRAKWDKKNRKEYQRNYRKNKNQ